MNSEQENIAGTYASNKDILSIFNEGTVDAKKKLQLLKWIKDLLDKPKHAHKEEEKLKGLEIESSVIQEIQKGDAQYRMQYFNRIIESILNEFNESVLKDGNIYVRSLTLKRWKERKVRLDENNKVFIIYSKKKTKTLNLVTYAIKWVGQKKDYQAFSLDSISSQNKYKQLLFGWTNFDGSRIWHDAIYRLINKIPSIKTDLVKYDGHQSMAVTSANTDQSSQSIIVNSSTIRETSPIIPQNQKRKASLQMNLQDQELEKAAKPSESLTLNIASKSKSTNNDHKQEQQNQNQINTDNKKVNGSSNNQPNQVNREKEEEKKQQQQQQQQQQVQTINNNITNNNINQEVNKVSPPSPLPPSAQQKDLQQIKEQTPINSSNNQQSQIQQSTNIQPSTSQPIQSDNNSKKENISPIKNEQQNIPTIIITESITEKPIKQIEEKKQESISSNEILSSPITNKIKSENSKETESQQQPQQQQQQFSLDHLDEFKTPQAITEFLQEYNLEQIKLETDYKSVSFVNGVNLLQNIEDPRKFKLFIAFQGVNCFEVFNSICNTDDYARWNNNVAETKVLNVMKNEQTAIIYQKHKGIGIMYRPRDFVYLRHAFVKNQQYYIIDKSIEYDSLPGSISIVRGEIEHVVWCFQTHPQDEGRSLMIADFYLNNSGYSNKEQDAAITFVYLQQFQNLSSFINQKSFSKSIANMFDINDQSQNKRSQIRSNNNNYSEKEDKANRQINNYNNEVYQQSSLGNITQQIESISPNSKQENSIQGSDKKEEIDITININNSTLTVNNNTNMTKTEEEIEEINQNSSNILSKTSLEQLENEKQNVIIAYEEEELQNQQLNNELSKYSEEVENQESSSYSEIPLSEQSSEPKPIIHVKPGDKLAGMTIPQIIEFVNKNKHWGVCVDQKYNMGRIECEEKRLKSDPEKGHYQFKKDWERCLKTGKFLFLNKEKIATQKKVISFLLSKIGSNILSGKSITSISLPIDIFESRSNLERFAYSCAFAPLYLKRAAELTDPLEQMKNCFVYLVTTSIMYLDLEKPFNPILGETYQGRLDGYPFYCEQISHHPPICSYLYYADNYKITGSLESIAQMHANSVTGINQGNVSVKFSKTGNEIGLIQAPGSLNGTAFGTRYMSIDGKYLCFDFKNKIVAEVKVNPDKKGFFKSATNTIDYMAGGIYSVTDKFINKLKGLKPHYYKFQGLNMKEDVVKQLATITGYWNKEIFIDDVKVYDIEDPLPYKLEHELNPIASDCNYRQDILYLSDRNKKDGQIYKELLENYQRADKKLREKGAEIRKKLLKKQKK